MTADIARALWLVPPRHAELRTEFLATPGSDELRIRTCFSAISRGTETLVYDGAVPESEYQRMRAPFQAGELPGPVKHGYANVGVVEAGPAAWRGRYVFCLYPHQTHYVAPVDAVISVPVNVPPARAVLAANMETAVNALWDAGPRIGDRVSVVGAGVIGSLVAGLCARLPGVEVELVDIDSERARIATALGAVFAAPDRAQRGRDLVFHASASAAGLNTALDLAGTEAEVIELSWFGSHPTTVALGGAFHSQRLTLRASQVGTVSPARAARWDHGRRLALALELCADPRFDVLFAVDAAFDDLPAVMARLAESTDRTLCQRIVYSETQDSSCST
ncbi:zinc-dependent alcohol dehydrogenase [Salinisphaera hydrothermalis]|uniref:Putative dehydrogenase n=1 Tax=Salinisphaera hydrothermalis (strain C41B8) TaxID=1304275 RepID=A0A084IQQ2_SALHC|nr:zinc-binding alcohol dehydrogenase [Salinisphaera hydrothermalis]KEZ79036.1 putative dehydrogenase [Salinisphaera hydrothermalis C41B8]